MWNRPARYGPVFIAFLLSACALTGSAARAEDKFYWVPLTQLKITDGQLPADRADQGWNDRSRWDELRPYAALDGAGEAYIVPSDARAGAFARPAILNSALAVRAPEGGNVGGIIFLPDAKSDRLVPLRFTIAASAPVPADPRPSFYFAKQWHYERLLGQGIPGGAWFRREARLAKLAVDPLAADDLNRDARRPNRPGQLEDTYALFSGGRALSENLQLDRVLPPREAAREAEVVALASVRGIKTQALNWKSKLNAAAREAERDPLARLIPHDQHALFFPSFDAVARLADEADRYGTLALHAVEPRSEDAGTRRRYERQLCLSLTGLGRVMGPHVIKSVAVTGSDPYLRVGSDVALIFEAKDDPNALANLLRTQAAFVRQRPRGVVGSGVVGSGPASTAPGNSAGGASSAGLREGGAQDLPRAEEVSGEIEGVKYSGAASADRAISYYIATLGNAAVVTNSRAQLARLVAVQQGKEPSIDSLDEYTFFRARYPRGKDDETAFLVLTDATIRRWCGPRWRIADSRRTRVAALLAELQAEHLDALVKGEVRADNRPHIDLYMPDLGELKVAPRGVTSGTYGSLEFMTPILELPIEQVSGAEARAYGRWRDTYESNWRQFFDPIAARLSMRPDGSVAADMTVMPLIQQTSYRPLISVTRDAALPPAAGDPHAQALAHFALAINPKSPTVTLGASFLANVLPGDKEDLLAALGPAVSVYVDEDPFWSEAAEAGRQSPLNFLLDNLDRAPLAVQLELKDGEAMTRYLAGARQWAGEEYPGWSRWETLEHAGQQYVKITAGEKMIAQQPRLKDGALCYANTGKAFILTPREDLLRRAIDRQKNPGGNAGAAEWLGGSAAMRVQPKAWEVLRQGMSRPYQQLMRRRAWDNLPILNEWKRRHPEADPVDLHERLWHARLVDPAGGAYTWNEKFRSMESTVYGHPAAPKDGPAAPGVLGSLLAAHFGLTFEPDGLRARATVERKPSAE
jgi:hypothetical protein